MKKLVSVMLLVCVVALTLAGCSNSASPASGSAPANSTPASGSEPAAAGTGTEASGKPVLIGVSNMVTGPMAAGGLRMKQTITMAFEEINANGGVLGGRPLEMVLVDDTGTPTGAVNAVNRILGSNVSASIGPHTSPMAAAAMDLYRKAEVPFVTGGTSPTLAEANNPYFFRISVSDSAVGKVMVKFAVDNFGAKKVAALHDTNDYGTAANNSTAEYCKENGIEYYSEGFTTGDKDLTSQLMKVKAWGPDVIFSFSHDAEVALHIRQAYELGMKDIPFVGPNALPMPQTLDLIEGAQMDGLYASTDYFGDTTDPVLNEFLTKFQNRWNESAERYAALYYSSSYLLADAINRAGSDDPKAIRDALAETKGFSTVMGELNCNEKGELNTNIFILQFDGNKNATVAQKVSLD